MAFNKKNGKTVSGFFKIRDFFLKSVLRKKAEFSVSDTGDPLILTCLVIIRLLAKLYESIYCHSMFLVYNLPPCVKLCT